MDSGGVSVARVKFELRDERGRVSPASELAAGVPIQREDKSPVTILLRSYMLLYPGDTLVCRLPLDAFRFEFLGKPGNYALSGVYSSGGLSYLRAYAGAGLTIEEVKSVPFASWSGTIETNKVSFKIVPAARLGKRTNK